jgi:WS/DGAT/MGAT family acyltransferase
MWFLPGLPNDRVGMFVTMHHAIADGIAAVASGRALLDTVADPPAASVRPWTPAPLPTARELLADNSRRHVDELRSAGSTLARPMTALRQVRAAWPAMHELFTTEPAPTTSLNRLVGPDRNLAPIRSGIDLVREIAHRHDATLNDVLLALTAGGLRGLLHSRGEPVEDVTVPIYVPVTLRQGPRDQARGNLIGQMVVPIPLGPTDPGRRLRQIATETAKRKTRSRPALGTVFRSRVLSGALLKVMNRRPVNVTTADVPGPQIPVYLAGAKVIEMFPVLPLIATVSLGVGALSYADQFNIMAIADRDAYPDLDVFTASAREELQALAATR